MQTSQIQNLKSLSETARQFQPGQKVKPIFVPIDRYRPNTGSGLSKKETLTVKSCNQVKNRGIYLLEFEEELGTYDSAFFKDDQ